MQNKILNIIRLPRSKLRKLMACFASILLISGGSAYAAGGPDKFDCAFEDASEQLYSEFPNLRAEVEGNKYSTPIQSPIEGILGIFNPKVITTYTIPVVFHIIHGNGAENITDKQIQDAINLLNEDYNGNDKDKDKIFSEFQSIYADVGMSFVLARKDPDGNPTDGITRHYAPQHTTKINNSMDRIIKEKYGWPQDKYLNIYVMRSAGSQAGSAWAYLPAQVNTAETAALDGVTISHWAVGRSGTATPTHYKTLTHEIGHWANLEHTFKNNCATDNDGVADTPPTLQGSGCDKRWEPCTTGTVANSQNYMDYGFCQKMFTTGQKTRMINAMTSTVGKRSSIYTAANLSATGITGMQVNALFYGDKNTIVPGASVTYTDDSETLSGNISSWEWTFPGGTPASHNGKTPPKIVYNTAGTYSATLKVTQGSNTNTVTKEGYVTVSADVVMRNDVIKTCSANFYDSGNNHAGKDGHYGNREDHKLVVLPNSNNSAVRVQFNSFLLENNSNCDLDYLKVYDGIDESATLMGTYCSNTNPGTLTSTNEHGALTFVFHSDVKSRTDGWDADLSCTSGNGGGNVAPFAESNGPYSVKATVNNTYSSEGSYDLDGEIASYSWNFGDGGSSTQANPSHAYNAIGTYNGTLTVTDDSGATGTSNFTVNVRANQADPLIVEANGPYHGIEGQGVTFSSTGTGDLDTAISSYSWNFGDETDASTVTTPTHTYKKPGTYTVTLTVTNANNESVSDTATVVIDDAPGDAPPAMVNACSSESPTANAAQIAHGDPICVAAISGTQTLVSYSFPNSYGNTVADAPRSIAITTQGGSGDIELVFKSGGWPSTTAYDAKSSLSGNNECLYIKHAADYWTYTGVISSGTGTSLVVDFNTSGCRNNGANQSPTASITAPTSGAVNTPIYFNGSASNDPDGAIVARTWNFGDGGTANISASNHTFTSAGTYNVSLTVTDVHGATGIANHTITIGGGSSSGGSSSGGSSSGGSSSGGSSGGSSSGGSSSGGSSSGGCAGASGCLTNGVAVTGLEATQNNRTSNYYIDVPAGATDLKIAISGGTGDADLYVKKGSVPTDSDYDCRPYDSGNAETCGVGGDTLATSEGRFHINLKAYSSFTGVSLTASYTGGGSSSGGSSSGGSSSGGSSSGGSSSGGSSSGGSSSGGSSSGGSSSGGSSSGGSSSGGSSSGGSSSGGSSSGGSSSGGSSSGGSSSGGCAGASGCLTNGVAVTGLEATQNNRTSNYYIDVPAGATDLKIAISGGTGDADLYVKKGSVPTDSDYDCRPYDSGNAETCGVGGDTLATSEGRFHINLKAYSSFTGVSLTASYTGGGSSSGGSSSGGSSSGGSSSGGSSSGGSSSGGSSSGGSSSGGSSSGGSSSGGSSSGGSSSGGIVDACASEGPTTGNNLTSGDAVCVPNGTQASSIQYYYLQVPANASTLTIQTDHGTGNGQLYYNASTWATATANTQSSTNSGNTESITVNNPAQGYRFFSVVGIRTGMTLLATVNSGAGNENTDGGSSGGGSGSAPYCSANGSGGYEWIANVEVGDFSNASGDGNYEDHTDQTITLNEGGNAITLTPGGNYTEHWKAWIDFNKDGDFDDTGETVLSGLSGKGAVNGTINIPTGTSVSTTMRIAMKYNGEASSSCGDIGDGEVEDYTVNINLGTSSGDTCSIAINEGEMLYDQSVCASRSTSGTNSYYIDVADNDTRLYITISGGSGDADILYNADESATASNHQYASEMEGNNETLEVTADAGLRYISLNTESSFDNVNFVISAAPPTSSDGGSGNSDGSSGIGDTGQTTADDPDCALTDTATDDAELNMYGFENKAADNYLQSWVRIRGTAVVESGGEYQMKFCPPKYGFIKLDHTGFEKLENPVQYASRFNYHYNHFGTRTDNNETVKVIGIVGNKKAVWTMPIDLTNNPTVDHPVTGGSCNDIKIDADFDGIPDCAEEAGKSFYNMPLYQWGARKNQMDVFIEVDYHAKHDLLNYAGQYILDDNNQRIQDHGTEPKRETIDRVVETFKAKGIHLHVDVGDLFDQASGLDPTDYDLGGGQAVPLTVANQYIHLARWTYNADHGTIQVPGMVEDIIPTYFENNANRKHIFYYMLFGHQQGGSNRGSSGIAPDLHDRYFIVSLGGQGWKLNDDTPENTNRLINLQSATFVHEFGHIIGLSHDGFPDDLTRNFKINYPSVMNYLFQLQGVPPEGGYTDADYNTMVRMRYYLNLNKAPDLICNDEMNAIHPNNKTWGNLIRGTSTNPSDIYIGFSDGKQSKIDETQTSEALLLDGAGLDQNCDGNIIASVGELDVNNDGQINYLWDYDDWGYLTFFFHYYNYDVKNEYDTSNEFMLSPNYHAQWGSSPTDVKYPGRAAPANTEGLSAKTHSMSAQPSKRAKKRKVLKSHTQLQAESNELIGIKEFILPKPARDALHKEMNESRKKFYRLKQETRNK